MRNLDQKAVTQLQEFLSRLLGKPVHLTITDNSLSMLHVRPSGGAYFLRLHHMFLRADSKVLDSLARYIRSPNKRAPIGLRDFVAANSDKIRKPTPRPQRTLLRHQGRYFNLKTIFDEVNSEYFDNKIDCLITWGVNRKVRNQNSIRLATYSEKTATIRVHTALDKSYVPKYVVTGIVYHEMLHHNLGVESHNGRKVAHSKTFRHMESRYRYHDELQAWKKKNLQRLLGKRG
jgi:hypothetical protein